MNAMLRGVRPPARLAANPLFVAAAACLLLGRSPTAEAQESHFSADRPEWSSVSQLVQIGRDSGHDVVVTERLDQGTLQPTDAVLIIHPNEAPPDLTSFLRAGGRVGLADDYGEGGSILAQFTIGRGDPDTEHALQLRGNPALLVARPVGSHRLTDDVPALVTNHPQMIYHRELSPIFELAPGEALVLSGSVGDGRLIVLADPSVLINNMLELRGNRQFAENLLNHLIEGRGGRLFVLGPEARIVGRYGEPGADRALHDIRRALERAASIEMPPLAIRIASLALAAIGIIMALGTLPRRSPYRSDRMFARDAAQGGFVGRVGFFARRRIDQFQPLMAYKFELEAAILARLSLDGRTLLKDVLGVMRELRIGETDIQDMRALLLELDTLHDRQDQLPGPPRIRPRRFRALVDRGERLLALIERRTAERGSPS